jgi:GntR family carbon starvation induced transcriptional regulator
MHQPTPSGIALAPEPQTLAAYAFERLRADLKANRFKPGERLRFEDMRDIYNVGVSPLREALSRLAETGLVVQSGQKGFRVAPASLEDLMDIIETRRFLEIRAVEDSIAHGDDRWERELVASFHSFSVVSRRKPETAGDYAGWEEHHAAFHRGLVGGCRSRWLLQFWGIVYDQAERYRQLAITSGVWVRGQISDHADLLDAALARDMERAATLLREHIGRSAEQLKPRLEQVLPATARRAGARGLNQTQRKLMALAGNGEQS